eukprot:c5675_g1_i1.p1 GENE.c5675_g1_i1~~c5675_g1_i1.p1  ORF type:complete len:553 (+),score=159.46 c5675_g1_i1:111-1661(+)
MRTQSKYVGVVVAVWLLVAVLVETTTTNNNNNEDINNETSGDLDVLLECGCKRSNHGEDYDEELGMGPVTRTPQQHELLKASLGTAESSSASSTPEPVPTQTPLDPNVIVAQASDDGGAACVCKRMRRPVRPIRCKKFSNNSTTDESNPEANNGCDESDDSDTIKLWSDIPREPQYFLPAVRIIGKFGFRVVNGSTFTESAKEWNTRYGYEILSALSFVTRLRTDFMRILGITRGPLAADFEIFTKDANSAEVIIGEIQESVGNGSFSQILAASFAPREVKVMVLSLTARRVSKYQPNIPSSYIPHSRQHIYTNHTLRYTHNANSTRFPNANHTNSHFHNGSNNGLEGSSEFHARNESSTQHNDNNEQKFSLPDLGSSDLDDSGDNGGEIDVKIPKPEIDVRCGTPKNVRREDIPRVGMKLKHSHFPPPPEHSTQQNANQLGAAINSVAVQTAQSMVKPAKYSDSLLEELQRLRQYVKWNTEEVSKTTSNISDMENELKRLQQELIVPQEQSMPGF